jgi:hypothetical protein
MGTAPLNQKWKLHFHVPALPVPTVSVRHCVSFGALDATDLPITPIFTKHSVERSGWA